MTMPIVIWLYKHESIENPLIFKWKFWAFMILFETWTQIDPVPCLWCTILTSTNKLYFLILLQFAIHFELLFLWIIVHLGIQCEVILLYDTNIATNVEANVL